MAKVTSASTDTPTKGSSTNATQIQVSFIDSVSIKH